MNKAKETCKALPVKKNLFPIKQKTQTTNTQQECFSVVFEKFLGENMLKIFANQMETFSLFVFFVYSQHSALWLAALKPNKQRNGD